MAGMAPDPLALEVSRLLSLLQNHYGAQARLAKRVDVSTSAISSWKAMKSAPEAERWAVIEDYFGLPAGHLTRVARGETPVGVVDPTQIDGMTVLGQPVSETSSVGIDAMVTEILDLVRSMESNLLMIAAAVLPVDSSDPTPAAGSGRRSPSRR